MDFFRIVLRRTLALCKYALMARLKADSKICSATLLAIIESHKQDNKLDDLIKLTMGKRIAY